MNNSASMRPDKLLSITQGVKGGKIHSNLQGSVKLVTSKGFNEPENAISIDTFVGTGRSYAPRQTALINIIFDNGYTWSGDFDKLQIALSSK